jgi:hypothetical protein
MVNSKNVSRADNQQERLKIESWISGFTDGEGCFSVSFIKNKTMRNGWQLFPEFVVTQGKKSLSALELIKDYLGCGNIFVNKRKDNHTENIYRYCVRSIMDLEQRVIPFFKRNKLLTYKDNDFQIFCKIVKMIAGQKHLTDHGIHEIAMLVQQMNRRKKSRFLESSETKR